MDVHENVPLDPCVGAIDVETVVLRTGKDIVNEMHDRTRPIAAGEIHHVVITDGGAEKVPQENAVPAAFDSSRAMDQLEFGCRGRKHAIADDKGGAVNVNVRRRI